jgi:hypothetical protein
METPTSHSPFQKKNKTPVTSATHGSISPAVQFTQFCPPSFKCYKPHFGWDCWLVSLQASHRYWQSLWIHFRPHQVINPPVTRPNITNIKLTHPALQCLQSLQGSVPLGEISKNLCINITQSTNDTQCLFSPGIYFVCRTAAYTCLLPGWKRTCTKALLTPQIDVVPGNHSLPIPLVAYT